MAKDHIPDDSSMYRFYSVASWVFLRLYGAAFGLWAWQIWKWREKEAEALDALPFGLSAENSMAISAGLALFLTVPFLTPGFIAMPRSLIAGVLKAILMGLLTVGLFVIVDTLLVLLTGQLIAMIIWPAVAMVFKGFAAIWIISSILIGFINQMNRSRIKPANHPKKKGRADPAPAPLSAEHVRALRQARMQRL